MSFRFQELEIWRDAIELSNELFDIAGTAEELKKFRFAEQLNGAVLSISNNIAEGSGASSKKEFARYLGIARSSIFEVANILYVYEQRTIIDKQTREDMFERLMYLSRKIFYFRKSLLTG